MNAKAFVSGVFCVVVTSLATAETKLVSYAFDRIEITGGDVIVAETEKVGAAYPDDLPTPLFWLDASDRTGWTVSDDGKVSMIPDKAGSGRFLTSAPDSGSYWGAVGQAKPTLTPPELVTDDAAFPHPYVDFGLWPGGHGLVFDGYKADASCSPSNTLENVGSVITVYGSQNGGGYFLYAAYSLSNGKEGRLAGAVRGNAFHVANNVRKPDDYGSRIFDGSGSGCSGFSPLGFGYMWQDGMMTACQSVGFNGGWQVLSLCPTNALVAYCGIGPSQFNYPNSNMGGQRVAEMLFFNKVLSNAEQRQVEEYLHAKWFAPQRGYDGNAHVGRLRVSKNADSMVGQVATLQVPAGEKLTVDRVQGGRGEGAALVKTGAGAIEFGDLSDYTGTLKLEGGTLAFTRKPVPALANLPEPYLHFDASAPDALEGYVENGTNFVTVWNNLSTNTWCKGSLITAARSLPFVWSGHTINTDCRYVENALGPGLHAVDFGNRKTTWTLQNKTDGYFGCMWFTSAETNKLQLAGVTTVIGVMGAQNGGGQVLGGSGSTHGWDNEPFARGGANSNAAQYWYEPLAKVYPSDLPESQFGNKATLWKTNVVSQVWVDGERDFIGGNFRTPGYHVVAQQTSGMSASILGGMTDGNGNLYNGGGRYCELLIYDRILSEQDVLDVSAYLKRKWFGGTSTGYARPADMKVADIQYLDVTAPSTIDVPAGATVKVGKLVLHAKLTKTGAGTLAVVASENPGAAALEVRGGAVVNADPSDVTAKCQLAESPTFHIDPSAASRITPLHPVNGSNCPVVDMVPDVRRPNSMRSRDGKGIDKAGPTLDTVNTQNGLPMFDFGSNYGYSRWCTLGESIDSVRHVYFVWDTRYGGGRPFGAGEIERLRVQTATGSSTYTEMNEAINDFKRTGNGANQPLFADSAAFFLCIEELRTNGVVVAAKNFKPDAASTYLVEVKLRVGAHISTIGMQNWMDNQTGALRLGEMVVYSRELTDRERTATSNYLMKKWMGASEASLPDLKPAEHREGPVVLDPFVVEGERVLDLNADCAVSEIRGEGTLVLNGDGKSFTSADLSFFDGTIAVSGGTLKLTGEQAPVDVAMPASGKILGVDSMKGVVEKAAKPGWLDKWYSTLDDGWYADGFTARISTPEDGLNGKPVIVMNHEDGQACCRFMDPTNSLNRLVDGYSMLENVRSVLWVVGSDMGGGFLLGGGTNAQNTFKASFARASWEVMDDPSQPLFNWTAQQEVREADWYINGEPVDGSKTGLSGAWDVVGMALQPDAADCTRTQGFAFSGDYGAYYFGHQKLAEVDIYDRVLSSDEILAAQAYLARKWGLRPYTQKVTNNAGVVLAADATLDCGAYKQYLAALGGTGAVDGDVETPSFLYDFDHPGTLTVDGTFAFGEDFSVAVTGTLPADLPATGVKILSATAFAKRENFNRTAVTGVEAGKLTLKLRPDGLYLGPVTGLLMLVR